jgi:DNA-binding transcriptional LysR family regulator
LSINGGLTEGAEALGKSQPSVSRTVAMLEARVGIAAVREEQAPASADRTLPGACRRRPQGSCGQQTASDVVRRYLDGKSGVVRVGGTPFFMDGVISGMIAEFQRGHPDVRIDQSYAYAPTFPWKG